MNIHDLARGLAPTHRQHLKARLVLPIALIAISATLEFLGHLLWIQQADLKQHASLVPVDALAPYLACAEANDADDDDFDFLVGGGDARQDPRHLACVLEVEVDFIHDVVGADGARDEAHVHGWRAVFQKIVAVEAL